MKKLLLVAQMALALILLGQPSQAAPVAVIDGTGHYTGFTGVDVGGTLYNIEFKDGTVASVFGGTFDFTTSATAGVAAAAIFNLLPLFPTLDADPSLMFGCELAGSIECDMLIPYDTSGSFTDVVAERNGEESAAILNGATDIPFSSSVDTTTDDQLVWADFSPAAAPAVPEPSTLSLFAVGLAGLFARRRAKSNALAG